MLRTLLYTAKLISLSTSCFIHVRDFAESPLHESSNQVNDLVLPTDSLISYSQLRYSESAPRRFNTINVIHYLYLLRQLLLTASCRSHLSYPLRSPPYNIHHYIYIGQDQRRHEERNMDEAASYILSTDLGDLDRMEERAGLYHPGVPDICIARKRRAS